MTERAKRLDAAMRAAKRAYVAAERKRSSFGSPSSSWSILKIARYNAARRAVDGAEREFGRLNSLARAIPVQEFETNPKRKAARKTSPRRYASDFEEIVSARLREAADLLGGSGGRTGRAKYNDHGDVIGRFRGYANAIPELAGMASPARIKAAIERGRGALYERIRWETERWALKHFPQYAPRQRGIVAGPHPGNRGCKICGRAHSAASHRSHGPGAFKQRGERVSPRMQGDLRVPAEVPDWVRNPVEIYPPTRGVVISGMRKGPGHPCGARCRAVGHRFRHRFPEGVRIVGNRDGTVTLQKAV